MTADLCQKRGSVADISTPYGLYTAQILNLQRERVFTEGPEWERKEKPFETVSSAWHGVHALS